MNSLQIKIIKYSDIDNSFLDQWKELAISGGDPFLSPEWLLPVLASNTDRYKLLAGFRGNKAVLIIPVQDTAFGLMRCIGGYISSEQQRTGLVRAGEDIEDTARLFLASLAARFNKPVLRIDFIKKEDNFGLELIRNLKRMGWHAEEFAGKESPFLELESDFDNYMAGRTRNARKGYFNRQRKLEKKFRITRELISTKEDFKKYLPELCRVEHLSWKGGSGIFGSENIKLTTKRFFAMAESNLLRIFLLFAEKSTIAFDIEFLFGDSLWSYNGAYDPEYAKYSPGIDLMLDAVRYGFDNNLQKFEFLGGSASYKLSWASGIRERSNIYLFPPGIKSRICPILLKSAKRMRKCFKKG